ncbi:MAG: hypothetical protein QW828_06190 [Candidatus Bathyarchaeia archaeon]
MRAAQRAFTSSERVALRMTGMGSRNAAQALEQELECRRPQQILMMGLAGALSLNLQVCDTVVYTACTDEAGHRLETASSKALLSRLTASGLKVTSGTGLTLSRMLCSASEKQKFSQHAIAVDMESYAVLKVASRYAVPTSIIRVISDDAHQDLPDLASAIDPDYQPNNVQMALRLMASPWLGVRFLYNLKRSLGVLTSAIRAVLEV